MNVRFAGAVIAPIVPGAFPGHPDLQIQACHRSFIRFMFPLPHCQNKTALAQNFSCARADKTNLWCHLACRCYGSRPLCREPTFPCSVTGAARQRILRAMPVSPCPPRTIMQTRSVSPSQHRGLSVTALCALLSLHWFKAFIPHLRAFVNTQFHFLGNTA